MAFIGSIEDRLAIRELYACYGDASSCANLNDWLACWADDGEWNTHIFERKGKTALGEQWDLIWANFSKVAFIGEVGAIEVDGDKALGRSVAQEIVRLKNGGIYKLIGRYEDQLVRKSGKWLFAKRNYEPIAEEVSG